MALGHVFKREAIWDFTWSYRFKFSDQQRMSYAHILRSFIALGFPVPTKHDQFVEGCRCLLVSLNDYGLIIRIHEHIPPDHQRILRPIWVFNQGEVHFDLLPGTQLSGDYKEGEHIVQELNNSGICFEDKLDSNLGELPGTNHKVIIDRGDNLDNYFYNNPHHLRPGIRDVTELADIPSDDIQKVFYGPLYGLAMECLPSTLGGSKAMLAQSDPRKIARFKAFCANEAARSRKGLWSLLQSNWSGEGVLAQPSQKGWKVKVAGDNYAKILPPLEPSQNFAKLEAWRSSYPIVTSSPRLTAASS